MTSTSTFALDPSLCLPALRQLKDVTLIYKSLNIEASILVLSLNSEYFANEMILYDKDTFEGQFDFSSVINVEEECFSLFIDAFYGKKVAITGKLFPDICHLASYFSFKTLKEACLTASLASKTTFEFKLDPQELFKKLLNWENSKYDQKLLFQAEFFNVHRFVLTTVSGYFAKFWGSNFQDSNDSEKDYSHLKVLLSSFKQFITLFYLQEIEINTENFYDFYYLSNYFQVKPLNDHLNSLLNILLSDINYLQSFIKSADNNEDMVAIEATLNHVQTASWQNVAPFSLRFESLEKLVSTGRIFILKCLAESVGEIGSGNFFRVLNNFPFSNISSQILFDVIIRPFIDDAEMSQNLIAKFGEALFSSTDVCHDLVYWVLSHVRMANKLPNYLKNRLLVIEPNFWNFDPLVMSNQIIGEIFELIVTSENFANWLVESLYHSAFDNRDISNFLTICSNYLKDVETKFLGTSGLNFYSKFIEKFNSHPSFSKICNKIFVSKVLPCLNASPSNVTITYKSKEYIVSDTKFSSSNFGAKSSSFDLSELIFPSTSFYHFITFLNTGFFHSSLLDILTSLIDASLRLQSVQLLNEILNQIVGHRVHFDWSAWTRPLSCDLLKNISINKLSWITRLFLIAGLIQDLQPIEPTPLRRSKKKGKDKNNITTQQQFAASTSSNSNVPLFNITNSLSLIIEDSAVRNNMGTVKGFLSLVAEKLVDQRLIEIPMFVLLIVNLFRRLPNNLENTAVALLTSCDLLSVPCFLLTSTTKSFYQFLAIYNTFASISDYEEHMKVFQHVEGNDDVIVAQVLAIQSLPLSFHKLVEQLNLKNEDFQRISNLSFPFSLLCSEFVTSFSTVEHSVSTLTLSLIRQVIPIITNGKRFSLVLRLLYNSDKSYWKACLLELLNHFDWKMISGLENRLPLCIRASDYLEFDTAVRELDCPLFTAVVRFSLLESSSQLPLLKLHGAKTFKCSNVSIPSCFLQYLFTVYCNSSSAEFMKLTESLGLQLGSDGVSLSLRVESWLSRNDIEFFVPYLNDFLPLLVLESNNILSLQRFNNVVSSLHNFLIILNTSIGVVAGSLIDGNSSEYVLPVTNPGHFAVSTRDLSSSRRQNRGRCVACNRHLHAMNLIMLHFSWFSLDLSSGQAVVHVSNKHRSRSHGGHSYCTCTSQYSLKDMKVTDLRVYELLNLDYSVTDNESSESILPLDGW
ncbi:hypothetical protein RCL1_008146 [Eukaryota sp. TZLM3-RCL]